jgi:uracil-DNA glycosylase
MKHLAALYREIVQCRACPRLVSWREQIGEEKRRAYRDWEYWARPVPGFGDPRARLAIVGLAPGAHGANRTGRMFTGDSSGKFLYAGLFRAGFANQASSESRGDGLELRGAYIVAALRCVPPDNRPTPDELSRCAPFLDRELGLLPVRVMLALGAIAWDASIRYLARQGATIPRPRPSFGHGVELSLPPAPVVLGCYHVSRQNTQTGKLTEAMWDSVLARAKELLAGCNR